MDNGDVQSESDCNTEAECSRRTKQWKDTYHGTKGTGNGKLSWRDPLFQSLAEEP